MGKLQHGKKIVSIIGALVFGAIIIFLANGADRMWGNNVSYQNEEESGMVDVSWKEGLSVISQKTSTNILGVRTTGTGSGEATTTTDRIARELLVNYALFQTGSATTTLSDENAEAIVLALIQKSNLPLKAYQIKDINVTPETSRASLVQYENDVQNILQRFAIAHTKDEFLLFSELLKKEDGVTRRELLSIADQYKNLLGNLLKTRTPKNIAALHLRLVQSYANIEQSVREMANVHQDAVPALSALGQYKTELALLQALEKDYQNYQLPE